MAQQTYVTLLRGINVGGHHKVPMAILRKEMEALGFSKVITLLNSGNVIFEVNDSPITRMEEVVAKHLKQVFGFVIPVWIIKGSDIKALIEKDPFQKVEVTKDTRLYVSFLKEPPQVALDLPWKSDDGSYTLIDVKGNIICSVFDLSVGSSTKGMDELEKIFGRAITTRNWNTIVRLGDKIKD